jgi:rhodanese-related sulfurtransferase
MKAGKKVGLVFGFLAILLVGSLPAAAKDKFEKEMETEEIAVKLVREVQKGGYGIITTSELKKLIDSGKDILIVDTMPFEASYQKNHVPGAKQFLFPVEEMTKWNTAQTGGKTQEDYKVLLGPDLSKTIVIYCGFVKCGRSHNGAAWAAKMGYTSVMRHPGGIFAWKGADYPCKKSK